MARPSLGKVHIGRRTETLPNGTKYIYERTTSYDPEAKKTRVLGCRLLGKILPGETEMVKTRYKKPSTRKVLEDVAAKKEPFESKRENLLLCRILEHIGKVSGLDKDLLACLPEGDALKAISLARYWLATGGDTLPHYEHWRRNHPAPYDYPITEDVYGKLFHDIGCNENGVQKYFFTRARHLEKKDCLALDSTTISTYSKNLLEAREGFNKDADGLPTVKLVTLYSIISGEPVAFATQPGNIPDVSSLENALAQAECLSIKDPIIVTDNGFYSESNIKYYIKNNIKFLTLANNRVKWIYDIIKECQSMLDYSCTVYNRNSKIRCICIEKLKDFSDETKDNQKSSKKIDKKPLTKKIYVHIIKNYDLFMDRNDNFLNELYSLQDRIENGDKDFSVAEEKKIKKYINIETGKNGKITTTINEEEYLEKSMEFGIFVLISNVISDPFVALRQYRLREKIEDTYAIYKGYLDLRKTRVWSDTSLRGRLFVQFIALSYYCILNKMISEIKNKLNNESNTGKSQERLLKDRLRRWLNASSMQEILNWFDAIETTTVKIKSKKISWETELTKRDNLLLNLLGLENS